MKRIKYLVISAAVLWGCSSDSFEQPGYYSTDASSPLGKAIVEASAGYVAHIQEESEVNSPAGPPSLRWLIPTWTVMQCAFSCSRPCSARFR